MIPYLTTCEIAAGDSTEIGGHTDAHRRRRGRAPRTGWASTRPFPAGTRNQAQKLTLKLEKVMASDLGLLDDAVAEITAAIDRSGCWEDTENIGLAVGEALSNAMLHGNHCDRAKSVSVSVAVNDHCDLLIVVKDSGSGFDPGRIANPTAAENVLVDHGRGIFLMKHFMDEVEFKFDHGTEVHMRRRRRRLE